MNKYLDLTSWILLFFFAPFTVLILLSQNTLPGDFLYPVKIGLENIVLAAASVSPSAKVAFRTDLTQTRFSEAQQLLAVKGNTTGFSDFVDEVSAAQQDLSSLSNVQTKAQSSQALIAKIDQYQQQLNQVQNQVQLAQNIAQPNQPIQNESQQQIQTQPNQITQTPSPLETSSPAFTPQPIKTMIPVPTSQPSQAPIQPSEAPIQTPTTVLTPVPTVAPLAPSVTNAIANNPIKAAEVTQTIKQTEEKLQQIKDEIKKQDELPKPQEEIHQQEGQPNRRQENGGNH